ncbi:MAG: hypothetical protein C0508_26890, partial [Cyanobacteria bacterium PR.023]|nr:hypothetical protein [Cyanobacteria bacterium PR.023]
MSLPNRTKTVGIITGASALAIGLVSTDIYPQWFSAPATAAEAAKTTLAKPDQATIFARLLSKGQFAQAHKIMDATMQAALPVNQLTMTWQSLLTQLGPLKSLSPNGCENIGACKKNLVTAEFERATVDLQIATKDAKISGFFIKPHQTNSSEPAYANKANFNEIPVKIGTNTGNGSYQLDGILSLPKGQGPFPAVVLVHGSGPCDIDETIGAVKV